MASNQHLEVEAAQYLQKLIQDSKDEPFKLARKLYVICQHMKFSGKESTLPYHVISRAMETVIAQHNINTDALVTSRIMVPEGARTGDLVCPHPSEKDVIGNPSSTSMQAMHLEVGSSGSSKSREDYHGIPFPDESETLQHDSVAIDRTSFLLHQEDGTENKNTPDLLKGHKISANFQEIHVSNLRLNEQATGKRKKIEFSDAFEAEPAYELNHDFDLKTGKRLKCLGPEGSTSFGVIKGFQSSSLHSGFSEPSFRYKNVDAHTQSPLGPCSLWNESKALVQEKDCLNHNIIPSGALAYLSNENTLVQPAMSPGDAKAGVSAADCKSSSQESHTFESHSGKMSKIQSNTVGSKIGTDGNAGILTDLTSNLIGTVSCTYVSGCGGLTLNVLQEGNDGLPSRKAPGQVFSQDDGNSSFSSGNAQLSQRTTLLGLQSKSESLQTKNFRQSSTAESERLQNSKDAVKTGEDAVNTNNLFDVPFREHQLKQLRAQCLVYLAFRNNLFPRKLHLEIATGNSHPREGGLQPQPDVHKKEVQIVDSACTQNTAVGSLRKNDKNETGREILPVNTPGYLSDVTPLATDAFRCSDVSEPLESDKAPIHEISMVIEGRKQIATKWKNDADVLVYEDASESSMNGERTSSYSQPDKDELELGLDQMDKSRHSSLCLPATETHMDNMEITSTAGNQPSPNDAFVSCDSVKEKMLHFEQVGAPKEVKKVGEDCIPDSILDVPLGKDQMLMSAETGGSSFLCCFGSIDGPTASKLVALRSPGDSNCLSGNDKSESQMSSENQRQLPSDDCQAINVGLDRCSVLEGISVANGPSSPPKYTTVEKWVLDEQRRKREAEKNWEDKQKKASEKMSTCFESLKEQVRCSEDISTKTRSVIDLKKLQLLQLQQQLRGDFLSDFFKPIALDIDRIKSVKKHRHGRRLKQLEKYEQKMREERLKRNRERQKEFFGEVETHRERLDDFFKLRRERWRGFNRYVKEFHKRKERINRERIDRIQREKINLLKNNDVEGYLRMVQDAKSDRVRELLKETERYLQKLGSKLKEAMILGKRFGAESLENKAVGESFDHDVSNGDASDQATHYLESNEKYYLLAHSVKEVIDKQPALLQGGKLREYQMNGLRWLVSLYNNNLNGILADEMGLGKTVQVIALICYLMEAKNDRGPFLIVVPSSVLPGWDSEINFWAPGIHKIAYAGSPEERRRLFKELISHHKFNVLLTTYEFLMTKHDRPKLSKIPWRYIIIDEGHRIKNASCKLNTDLKQFQSSHRLLMTGTPLQNNLDELWALLNFLLPKIFNSSEDFSQWFSKPFESGNDASPDEVLLSEEENLLIINRLHQVLRPFVLRRLKHKVENELPEKIERLIRCEASAYQKLLMKRVEENLGTIGSAKARAVHNTVMELRNICNHPYLSQLHADEVNFLIPRHYLPPIVRLCGKLEMLDRLLPKLKATDHRILFFSTMTRMLDLMEEYLCWKRYRYLRLDGHTSGNERGALIEEFNRPDSSAFIFLLSIRAGGVGVNLQAADTVIIFDTDWNPQVDLQAQARAHRIGQKKDVLVLRFETIRTVEEQVRAAAEHKLGVADQSITAGFFDNHTSAEDRKEYLESLLRGCKKEESDQVLNDDALNDLLARSEKEIDIFELVDKRRREEEMEAWQGLVNGHIKVATEPLPPMPSRLVVEGDLMMFYNAMRINEASSIGSVHKSRCDEGFDTQQYGRGKRAREVRCYEDQWTEEEFEKICQVESHKTLALKELPRNASMTSCPGEPNIVIGEAESSVEMVSKEQQTPLEPAGVPFEALVLQSEAPNSLLTHIADASQDGTLPAKRRRGRPKRVKMFSPISSAHIPLGSFVSATPAAAGSSQESETSGGATISDTSNCKSTGNAEATNEVLSIFADRPPRKRTKKEVSHQKIIPLNFVPSLPKEFALSPHTPAVAFTQDGRIFVRPIGTLNAHGFTFQVNPMCGLQNTVDLIPRGTASVSNQAKQRNMANVQNKMVIASSTPVAESRFAASSIEDKVLGIIAEGKSGTDTTLLKIDGDKNLPLSLSTPVESRLLPDETDSPKLQSMQLVSEKCNQQASSPTSRTENAGTSKSRIESVVPSEQKTGNIRNDRMDDFDIDQRSWGQNMQLEKCKLQVTSPASITENASTTTKSSIEPVLPCEQKTGNIENVRMNIGIDQRREQLNLFDHSQLPAHKLESSALEAKLSHQPLNMRGSGGAGTLKSKPKLVQRGKSVDLTAKLVRNHVSDIRKEVMVTEMPPAGRPVSRRKASRDGGTAKATVKRKGTATTVSPATAVNNLYSKESGNSIMQMVFSVGYGHSVNNREQTRNLSSCSEEKCDRGKCIPIEKESDFFKTDGFGLTSDIARATYEVLPSQESNTGNEDNRVYAEVHLSEKIPAPLVSPKKDKLAQNIDIAEAKNEIDKANAPANSSGYTAVDVAQIMHSSQQHAFVEKSDVVALFDEKQTEQPFADGSEITCGMQTFVVANDKSTSLAGKTSVTSADSMNNSHLSASSSFASQPKPFLEESSVMEARGKVNELDSIIQGTSDHLPVDKFNNIDVPGACGDEDDVDKSCLEEKLSSSIQEMEVSGLPEEDDGKASAKLLSLLPTDIPSPGEETGHGPVQLSDGCSINGNTSH